MFSRYINSFCSESACLLPNSIQHQAALFSQPHSKVSSILAMGHSLEQAWADTFLPYALLVYRRCFSGSNFPRCWRARCIRNHRRRFNHLPAGEQEEECLHDIPAPRMHPSSSKKCSSHCACILDLRYSPAGVSHSLRLFKSSLNIERKSSRFSSFATFPSVRFFDSSIHEPKLSMFSL
jgi:hypothetical protein